VGVNFRGLDQLPDNVRRIQEGGSFLIAAADPKKNRGPENPGLVLFNDESSQQ
jgi:hypothetical protein